VEGTIICEGDSVELDVEGRADTYDWLLSPYLSSLSVSNPVAFPPATTTFTVIASLATCEPDTATVTVHILTAPVIITDTQIEYFAGQDVKLHVFVDGQSNYIYEWMSNSNISCYTCNNPIFYPEGVDTLTVLVTDTETGCSSLETIYFNLLEDCPEELISVPNIFTPNGDGINDRIKIFLSETLKDEIYSYRIFNRWGTLLFETEESHEGWDGTFKGRDMPIGTYIYMVEAPCVVNGGRIVKKGDFVLMR
jgi:gliding motility-associated-like protein